MDYKLLRIKDDDLFWKLKKSAILRRMTIIDALEEAIKDWVKKKL